MRIDPSIAQIEYDHRSLRADPDGNNFVEFENVSPGE
jgi:hypothetical protein